MPLQAAALLGAGMAGLTHIGIVQFIAKIFVVGLTVVLLLLF